MKYKLRLKPTRRWVGERKLRIGCSRLPEDWMVGNKTNTLIVLLIFGSTCWWKDFNFLLVRCVDVDDFLTLLFVSGLSWLFQCDLTSANGISDLVLMDSVAMQVARSLVPGHLHVWGTGMCVCVCVMLQISCIIVSGAQGGNNLVSAALSGYTRHQTAKPGEHSIKIPVMNQVFLWVGFQPGNHFLGVFWAEEYLLSG